MVSLAPPAAAAAHATAAATALGTAVGVATFYGQGQFDGVGNAFVNSAAMWVVAPFLVGALARTRAHAALAGLIACLAEVVGYYVAADLNGYSAPLFELIHWTVCAFPGGVVFGAAGHLWRTRPRLGAAILAGAFVLEGAYTYAYALHRPETAAVWAAIALAITATLGRAAARPTPTPTPSSWPSRAPTSSS
jgi:hypothetical protein